MQWFKDTDLCVLLRSNETRQKITQQKIPETKVTSGSYNFYLFFFKCQPHTLVLAE